MTSALRALLIVVALLGAFQRVSAAPLQGVPGTRVNEAAESFVGKAVAAPAAEVHSLYRVPDRTVPSGALAFRPHWPANAVPPVAGFRGRLNVPVSVLAGGVIVDEVLVQVQVGPTSVAPAARLAQSGGPVLKNGDPVHVQLQGSGLRIVMTGTVQQAGNPGDRIRVAVQAPYRVLFATIVNEREVTVEPEP